MAAVNVQAAPLKVVKVNAPAINCLFSSNCTVTVNDTVASFTTNLPPFTAGSTNASLSGFLQSRAYPGQPGTQEAGLNAYEYRLVLKNLTGAKSVSINSMTLNFSPYSSFAYNGQPNKQVWVVTSGGLGSAGPATVSAGHESDFSFQSAVDTLKRFQSGNKFILFRDDFPDNASNCGKWLGQFHGFGKIDGWWNRSV